MAGRGGRPKIKLTAERREEALDCIGRGLSVDATCAELGISRKVFYRWQRENSEFGEACQRMRREALKALKSDAENCIASKISKKEGDSWRAAAWFLSHKHPAEYAEKRILDQTHDVKSPAELVAAILDGGDDDSDD